MYQKKQYLGRIVECMFCQEQIKFAVLSGMSLPLVYFYAASNNDVLMRADWARFKGNLKLRLTDPAIILIDGCTVDSDQGTYVVDVVF